MTVSTCSAEASTARNFRSGIAAPCELKHAVAVIAFLVKRVISIGSARRSQSVVFAIVLRLCVRTLIVRTGNALRRVERERVGEGLHRGSDPFARGRADSRLRLAGDARINAVLRERRSVFELDILRNGRRGTFRGGARRGIVYDRTVHAGAGHISGIILKAALGRLGNAVRTICSIWRVISS